MEQRPGHQPSPSEADLPLSREEHSDRPPVQDVSQIGQEGRLAVPETDQPIYVTIRYHDLQSGTARNYRVWTNNPYGLADREAIEAEQLRRDFIERYLLPISDDPGRVRYLLPIL